MCLSWDRSNSPYCEEQSREKHLGVSLNQEGHKNRLLLAAVQPYLMLHPSSLSLSLSFNGHVPVELNQRDEAE